MKYLLVSCKDVQSGVFTPPIPFRSEGECIRAYGEAIPKDPMLSRYPQDFELYSVASWDNEDCAFIPQSKRICAISDIIVPTSRSVESEVPADGGTFPSVQESSQVSHQVDTDLDKESFVSEQKRCFSFGVCKK